MELKHIVGYLPYGLKAVMTVDAREEFSNLDIDNYYVFDKNSIWTYCGYADEDLNIPLGEGEINGLILRNGFTYADVKNFSKPIMRPMSDVTKEIEVNGEKLVPLDLICEIYPVDIDEKGICSSSTDEFGILHLPYSVIKKLYEWHFDIHGLIEKGEAIDIDTLSNEKL